MLDRPGGGPPGRLTGAGPGRRAPRQTDSGGPGPDGAGRPGWAEPL